MDRAGLGVQLVRTPWLSVVVIGRNEGQRLERCLDSVLAMGLPAEAETREEMSSAANEMVDGRAQTAGDFSLTEDVFPQVELIYVDSGSTDGSVALATLKGWRVLSLGMGRPTAARGRNAGWRAARGTTVLFLDGDTVLHPSFVLEAMPAFKQADTAVVWGHRRELFPEHSVYNRVMDLDWVYEPGYTGFCGGDALFRREALEAVGGFDETLIAGEEPELCRRLSAGGYRMLHVDLPMTGHDLAVLRFGQYWRRATRAGHAYAEVAERFRGTEHPFWSREVDRNRRRALVLVTVAPIGLLLSVLAGNVLPLLVVFGLLIALAVRTAWKARWKGGGAVTLLLYGVHSHVQQIPIYWGQLKFLRNQRAGRAAGLVEYK